MKRLLMVCLMAVALSLTATAWAVETQFPSSTEKVVSATYRPSQDPGTVYSVDVVWGNMEFEYSEASSGVWNPQSHTYENTTAAGWRPSTENANVVSITNHSNAGVSCQVSYKPEPPYNMITGTLTNESFSLPSAENKPSTDTALTKDVALTLSGTFPTDAGTQSLIVGMITVTLSAS